MVNLVIDKNQIKHDDKEKLSKIIRQILIDILDNVEEFGLKVFEKDFIDSKIFGKHIPHREIFFFIAGYSDILLKIDFNVLIYKSAGYLCIINIRYFEDFIQIVGKIDNDESDIVLGFEGFAKTKETVSDLISQYILSNYEQFVDYGK